LGIPRLEIAVLRWAVGSRFAGEWIARELVARAQERGDTDALITGHEAVLRAAPSDMPTMTTLAAVLLRSREPARAEAVYARINELTNGSKTMLYRSAPLDATRAAQGEPYVARLENVLLETHHCALFKNGHVYWREISGRNIANQAHVVATTPDLSIVAAKLPPSSRTIEDPVILLGTDGAYNYSHWLARNVPKLSLVDDATFKSLPILVNQDLCAYQDEYLQLLGVAPDRLFRLPTRTVVTSRELFVPTILHGHRRMRGAIDWIRDRVSHLMVPTEAATDRIYVSRKDAPQRVLLNEDEVEAALTKLGFQIVTLTGMSVRDQIALFSRARYIVGPHGAGLTNVMFAPPGATVVEITNTKIRHMGDFRSIAFHMNQRHIEIVSGWYPEPEADTAIDKGQHADYLVSVEDVVTAVEEELAHGT
jgi:glycosyl transferase family 61